MSDTTNSSSTSAPVTATVNTTAAPVKIHNSNNFQTQIKVNGETVFLPPRTTHTFAASTVNMGSLPPGVRQVKDFTPAKK